MGLDSFWMKPCSPGDTAPVVEFDPPLNLCGGMFSGAGQGSFRGKAYAELIEHISGVSIYEEWIWPGTLEDIVKSLQEFRGEHPDTDTLYAALLEIDPWISKEEPPSQAAREFDDLIRMFAAYSEAGFCLHGWW